MTYIDTRTFKSGDGVAVPLSAELGLDPDTPVRIERRAGNVIITPLSEIEQWRRDAELLRAELKAIGPIIPRETRDTDPIPERPGL